ncbi:hypothetical protein DCF50_p558 [Dehalobacter sp. CF]|nr:hypothetical protein DCF50_p558 [Dehalobacter sp. CF]
MPAALSAFDAAILLFFVHNFVTMIIHCWIFFFEKLKN